MRAAGDDDDGDDDNGDGDDGDDKLPMPVLVEEERPSSCSRAAEASFRKTPSDFFVSLTSVHE